MYHHLKLLLNYPLVPRLKLNPPGQSPPGGDEHHHRSRHRHWQQIPLQVWICIVLYSDKIVCKLSKNETKKSFHPGPPWLFLEPSRSETGNKKKVAQLFPRKCFALHCQPGLDHLCCIARLAGLGQPASQPFSTGTSIVSAYLKAHISHFTDSRIEFVFQAPWTAPVPPKTWWFIFGAEWVNCLLLMVNWVVTSLLFQRQPHHEPSSLGSMGNFPLRIQRNRNILSSVLSEDIKLKISVST